MAKTSIAKNAYQNYFRRFFIHPRSKGLALPAFDMAIVIPSYQEEHLFETLHSLAKSKRPEKLDWIVLVVINDKVEDEAEIHSRSKRDLESLEKSQGKWPFPLFYIDATQLKDKNAGVGLARKIGLDACILSLESESQNPWLVCLDADCLVSENYLTCLASLVQNEEASLATFRFLHNIPPGSSLELSSGIKHYELFLEYYRLGLQFSGYPFFLHTVGSSMAFRAIPYARSGGMNQRKAGEDFYFLHKLFPHYQVFEISENLVFPSARISDRVPFGTGRFQQKWIGEERTFLLTYHPEIFNGLRLLLTGFFESIENGFQDLNFEPFFNWHPMAISFFEQEEMKRQLNLAIQSSKQEIQKRKAVFRWFDGLAVLKFVHYFHEKFPPTDLLLAVSTLFPGTEDDQAIDEKLSLIRNFLHQKFKDSSLFS
jgi:hypothetical protein